MSNSSRTHSKNYKWKIETDLPEYTDFRFFGNVNARCPFKKKTPRQPYWIKLICCSTQNTTLSSLVVEWKIRHVMFTPAANLQATSCSCDAIRGRSYFLFENGDPQLGLGMAASVSLGLSVLFLHLQHKNTHDRRIESP